MVGLKKPAAMLASLAVAGGVIGAAAATPASAGVRAHAAAPTVKVMVSPTISSVDVWYALRAGLFKKEGLNVKVTVNTGSGPSSFPLVLNGQENFTVSDPVSVILAIQKGLGLQIGAEGNVVAAKPSKDYIGLEVKSGSGITSPKDLDGKTVAVNALDSILQMWAEYTIDSAGGKSSTVKFVEVPPLSEVDAVAKGQVSAFENVEPLLSTGESSGLKLLAHPPASIGGLPEDLLVTSASYAKAHPTVVKQFRAAITRANKALAAKPSLMVSTASAEKEVTPALLHKIIYPVFSGGTVSASSLTKLMGFMVKYHILSKPVATSKLLG